MINKLGILIMLSLFLVLPSLVLCLDTEKGPNLENKAVKKVPPTYPPLAKRKRIEGAVTIKVQTNADGTVSAAEFLDGNSLFKPASIEAAKQWLFQKSQSGMSGYIVFKFRLEEE